MTSQPDASANHAQPAVPVGSLPSAAPHQPRAAAGALKPKPRGRAPKGKAWDGKSGEWIVGSGAAGEETSGRQRCVDGAVPAGGPVDPSAAGSFTLHCAPLRPPCSVPPTLCFLTAHCLLPRYSPYTPHIRKSVWVVSFHSHGSYAVYFSLFVMCYTLQLSSPSLTIRSRFVTVARV